MDLIIKKKKEAERENYLTISKEILNMKVRLNFFKPLPNMTFLKGDRSRHLKL